jgi:integrase
MLRAGRGIYDASSSGDGTIEQVGERYRFKTPDGSGDRYTSPAEYESEAAAIRGLAIYRRQILAGELTPADGLTLRQFVETTWLPRMEREKPRSVKTYRSNWNSQISKARFADMPLSSIRRRDVRAWIDRMGLDHPESPAGVLKTILGAAMDAEIVPHNVAEKLRLPRAERRDTCPTPEEQDAIFYCQEIPICERVMCITMSWTATRPGEARNQSLDDLVVDGPDPHLWVRKGTDDGPPKNGKARRVPLLGLALEALRAWLLLLPEYAPHNPLGLVFPFADGRRRPATHPFGTMGCRDLWHVYRDMAGITRPVRLHDFRHAAATDFLNGDRGRQWTLAEVQRLLDHSSVVTTESRYAHRRNALLDRAAAEQRSVQISPGVITKGLEKPSNPPFSQLSHSSSSNPSERPEATIYPEIAAGWTDAGLISELRVVLARVAKRNDGQEAALSIGRRLQQARRRADPIERAIERLDSPHWKAALVELADLLIPDVQAKPVRKGGAR